MDFVLINFLINLVRYNISNTRKSVSSDIQTLRSGLKKPGAADKASQNINNS